MLTTTRMPGAGPENPTLAEALALADLGWRVFPAKIDPDGSKSGCVSGKDRGARWGATTDPETLRGYWRQFPEALLGIAAQESGLVVIDLDRKPDADGLAWLADMEARHGAMPHTVTATTPSGGRHLYFRYPDFDPKTCAGAVAPGVDVRGHGGMVLAPPTWRADKGAGYAWSTGPDTAGVAPLPAWLAADLPRRGADREKRPPDDIPLGPPDPAMVAEVRELLGMFEPPKDNDAWYPLMMGIHDATLGSDEGFALADAWSARDPEKYEARQVKQRWHSFTPGRGYSIDTLRRHAKHVRPLELQFPGGPPDYLPAGASRRPPASHGFTFQAVGDLTLRPPEFLVNGLIETGTLGDLFGDPGAGKSFFALDLAASTASGQPFHGRAVRQGPVLYLAGEGHSGLARRAYAWASHHGRALKGLPLFISNKAAQFLDKASAETVTRAAEAEAAKAGPPALLVVDTLARNFGPGDENSTSDMSAFVAAMDDLKARWPGCVVLVVHHSGHGDKSRGRGSIALTGGADFEYRLSQSDGVLTVTNCKMKDAPQPPDMAFRLVSVPLTEGAGSAVLVPTAAPMGGTRDKLTATQKTALRAFKAAADEQDGWEGLHLEQWRRAFYSAHHGANPQSKERMFNRVRGELAEKSVVSVENDIYTIIDRLALNSAGQPDNFGQVRTNPPVQPGQTGQMPIGMSVVRHDGGHFLK